MSERMLLPGQIEIIATLMTDDGSESEWIGAVTVGDDHLITFPFGTAAMLSGDAPWKRGFTIRPQDI